MPFHIGEATEFGRQHCNSRMGPTLIHSLRSPGIKSKSGTERMILQENRLTTMSTRAQMILLLGSGRALRLLMVSSSHEPGFLMSPCAMVGFLRALIDSLLGQTKSGTKSYSSYLSRHINACTWQFYSRMVQCTCFMELVKLTLC